MYDRNHYFGLGPILKPKLKMADTFGRVPYLAKTTFQREKVSGKKIGSDTGTETGPWFLFPIWKPHFGCTLVHSDLNEQNLFHSTTDAPLGVPGMSKNWDDQT